MQPIMTKNGSTAHPYQQNTKRHSCRNNNQPVILGQPESSALRAWEESVNASRHSAASAQTGMQPRRLRRAFCLKCNCFRNVPGMHTQLLFPDLFFCFFPPQYTLYFTDFRELFEHQCGKKGGEETVKCTLFLPASDTLINSKGCLMSSVRPICREIKLFSRQTCFCMTH